MRVRLRSSRAARMIAVVLPTGRHVDVVVEGQTAVPRQGAVAFPGIPDDGIEIVLSAAGTSPIDLTVFDVTQGVPAEGQLVRDARPKTAVQTQEGDVTISSRHMQL